MDSSDDSFAWTSASSASDVSEQINMSESESDKKYKKKLLEEAEAEVKHELLNGEVNPESSKKFKKKLKKQLLKEQAEADIKLELLNSKSHVESSEEAGSGHGERQARASSQDSHLEQKYLNKRVKQEANSYTIDYDASFDSKPNSDTEFNEHKNSTKKKTKKKDKKEKKSHTSSNSDQEIHRNSITEEVEELQTLHNSETQLNSKKEKKKKKKYESNISSSLDENIELEEAEQSTNYEIEEFSQNNVEETRTRESVSSHNLPLVQQSKISDRIQFEDEEQENNSFKNSTETEPHSSKLKRFLKANSHLQVVNCQSSQFSISDDEEIWLLNCPHEVNTDALQGVDLTLDSKCKIKIDSHTYVGNVQDENTRLPVVLCKSKKATIKNIKINGVINFHKRIPKPHYFEDNMVQNNQTDFIPLPETKSRHPLFGADYKKAMKIPNAIKKRLIVSNDIDTPDVKKKKKKKDYNSEHVKKESHTDSMVDPVPSKESRKRKKSSIQDSSDDVQILPKKKKRIKQELRSAESWESERAIEENLFNL